MRIMSLIGILLISAGCTGSTSMAEIETAFTVLASDCAFTQGILYVPRKRVANAPPTVWEKKGAICWYADGTPPRVMSWDR